MISSRAPIGYVAIANKELTTNQGCKSLVLNENFDAKFVYYSLLQNVERLKKVGGGTTFAEISKGDLEKVKLPHPNDKSEQQHIARILSTADAVIENTQAAIAKYQAIKQGMLQDVFTRGIDLRTGALRPRYEDAPHLYKESALGWIPREWEVDEIQNISSRIWIGLVTTMTTNYVLEGIPLIRNNNIRDNIIERDNMIKLDNNFSQANSQRYLHQGDIVTVHTGDVGTSAIIDESLDPSHGFATINTTVDSKKMLNQYLCYYLNWSTLKTRIEIYITGDGRNNLNLYDYVIIPVAFPVSLLEQETIAMKINSISHCIQTEQMYLQKMQVLKKGLMEDLLTGKVRVAEDVIGA